MSIAELVHRCLDALESAEARFDGNGLLDEVGRFRIWAGNVSAHSTGKRSLQYRLRESKYLTATVTSYLKDLLEVLLGHDMHCSPVDADIADGSVSEEDDATLFGSTANAATTSASEVIEEINSIITCLMRVSTALRNPAKDDQVRYALDNSVKHFAPHDIEHVRTKFPHAPAHIIETLGAALSKHRLYFKYREEHHEKLAEGVDGATEERPSTVATSLALGKKAKESSEIPTDTESMYTATSFATTKSGDSNLRLPPLPHDGADGLPFECPLCFHMVEMPDERSWQRHVYEDLPPYVCLLSDCRLRGRQFSCRRDWQRHLKEHRQYWICPFDCSDTFQEPGAFKKHLKVKHDQLGGEAAMDRLLHCSMRVAESECVPCPLCLEKQPDTKASLKHLGHHMQQLALFALPSRVYDEADGIESPADHGSDSVEMETTPGPLRADLEQQDLVSQHLEDVLNVKASVCSSRSSGSPASSVSGRRSMGIDAQSPVGESSRMSTPDQGPDLNVDIAGALHRNSRSRAEATRNENAQNTLQVHWNDTDSIAESDSKLTKHDGLLFDKPLDELYECTWPGCSHKSGLMCELRKHFQTQHRPTDPRPHGCPHCSKRFNWPKDVRRHLRQKHKDLAQPQFDLYRLPEDDFSESERNALPPAVSEEKGESVDLEKIAESARRKSTDLSFPSQDTEFQLGGRTPVSARYSGQEPPYAPSYPQSNDGAPTGYVRRGNYYVPVTSFEPTPSMPSRVDNNDPRSFGILVSESTVLQSTPDGELFNTLLAPDRRGIEPWSTPDDRAGDSRPTDVSQSIGHDQGSSTGATTQVPKSSSQIDSVISRRLKGAAGDFVCHFCSTGFATQGDLTFHLRAHQPYMSRQHVCQHCEKRFHFRKDLMRHLPKHDPNRKKHCCTFPDCKYHTRGFGRQDHLERHLRSQHPIEAPRQQDAGPTARKASLPSFRQLAELAEAAVRDTKYADRDQHGQPQRRDDVSLTTRQDT